VAVLKRKEDERLLKLSGTLSQSHFFNNFFDKPDASTFFLVHPGLVRRPKAVETLISILEAPPTIIFLRRDPYERALSEFLMLRSINGGGQNNDFETRLARQAIDGSNYVPLETAVRKVCSGCCFQTLDYLAGVREPWTLLQGGSSDLRRVVEHRLLQTGQLDANSVQDRRPLRRSAFALASQRLYSSLIHTSDTSYKFAKFLKNSRIVKGEFNSQVQLDLSVRGQAAVASVACL